MLQRITLTVSLIALAVCSSAQTVTVNKAGGAGIFTSISSALSSFNPDTNPAPNIINITDSAVYDEVFTIAVPVTIQATGTSATLAVKSNGMGQFENGGIFINLPSSSTTGTVVLRNLKVIPALDTNSLRLKSAIENGNNNLFLWLDNVMIAPNAGDNTALDTQGGFNSRVYETYVNANGTYDPNIVLFGAHGLVLGDTETGYSEGSGVELRVTNSVITHFRDDLYEPAPKPACYAIWMKPHYPTMTEPFPAPFRLTRIDGTSVISYCQFGLVAYGDIDIQNPGGHVYFRGLGNYAAWWSSLAPNYRQIRNLIIDGCASGIIDQGYGTVRMDMWDSIIYYITSRMLYVQRPANQTSSSGAGNVNYERCTLVAGRNNSATGRNIEIPPGVQGLNINFKDSIVGGKDQPDSDANNVIFLGGTAATTSTITLTVNGSALTTSGLFALRPGNPFSTGVGAISFPPANSYLAADPSFVGVLATNLDPYKPNFPFPAPGFMNVQNPSYANANSTGGPLGGGAQYVGPPAAIKDWNLY